MVKYCKQVEWKTLRQKQLRNKGSLVKSNAHCICNREPALPIIIITKRITKNFADWRKLLPNKIACFWWIQDSFKIKHSDKTNFLVECYLRIKGRWSSPTLVRIDGKKSFQKVHSTFWEFFTPFPQRTYIGMLGFEHNCKRKFWSFPVILGWRATKLEDFV